MEAGGARREGVVQARRAGVEKGNGQAWRGAGRAGGGSDASADTAEQNVPLRRDRAEEGEGRLGRGV